MLPDAVPEQVVVISVHPPAGVNALEVVLFRPTTAYSRSPFSTPIGVLIAPVVVVAAIVFWADDPMNITGCWRLELRTAVVALDPAGLVTSPVSAAVEPVGSVPVTLTMLIAGAEQKDGATPTPPEQSTDPVATSESNENALELVA